ncbi:MAG: outer membrane protein assembly factor BamA [Sphingomonas sp.]|nr:outer membrane protein assembly factor BamA [Sphingomonas sp.]
MLLAGSILGGWSAPLLAQEAAPPPTATPPVTQAAPAPAPSVAESGPAANSQMIRSIAVRGNERLEPETVRAYANLNPGTTYTAASLDAALKDLYATELFTDVVITGAETGNLVITIRENPVINRIVLEGNKRLKSDKILPEIKLAPRQIFTRSKVRADVERIVELYRREGRFAAQVEPKIVQLDQNRVDLVFEIFEGDKSKVRQINIIGNNQFDDGRLRKEMYTRQAGGMLGFLKSNDSYDPDRLAADQQKLRSFYLTQGYADFRVVSALAELTPDRRDFIITYVVEEGPRYKFGTIEAESALRDLTPATVKETVDLKSGDWFNAQAVENAVTKLTDAAGLLGYAFADIDPSFDRDADKRVMNVTLRVGDTPRVYVERIEVQGNTVTHDKVVRREFRLNEGDAFNALKVKRSQDRLQSLGFFQEKLEIKQTEGSGPDRVVLGIDVEEKATGELSLAGGYSSLERFVLQLSIAQRNFMGKGQEVNAGINYSRYSRSVQLGFTEPYLFDKQIALGGEIYRRDYSNYNLIGGERNKSYEQVSTGLGLRLGFPVTEFINFAGRYSLVMDKITLDRTTFYSDPDGAGPQDLECDPLRAGTYLCDQVGTRVTSLVGVSGVFDNTNGIRPTRGQRILLSQDFAGLGGDVKYLRSRADATKYFEVSQGWVVSTHLEGGYIHSLNDSPRPGQDPVRLTDRFFGPQLRGFDIRGIGPRVLRTPYDIEGNLNEDGSRTSDALGGHAYYMGRVELEVPVGASVRSLGLRPSAFVDVGSVFGLTRPVLNNVIATCVPVAANTTLPLFQITPDDLNGNSCGPTEGPTGFTRIAGVREEFLGNSASPRLAIGVGVNWISPFGPFRIDIARALLKQRGDDTKLFSFNVGTQF